jgi:hypothetical protein
MAHPMRLLAGALVFAGALLAGAAAHANASASALDRTARILAGIEAASPAEIALPEATLQRYARSTSQRWQHYERSIGGPMRAWARTEIAAAPDATIFYPFAGPDLPTVHGLYPLAGRYVLVALQPAEAPLALDAAAPAEVAALLDRFGRSWEQFSHLGFFRTPDLDANARHEGLRSGLTAVLMAFSARLGMSIVSIEPVRVNADGTDLETHPGDRTDPLTWRSVRMRLSADGRSVVVDYVRADLSDAGFANAPALRTWIEGMAAHRTLLKAASHLLQRPSFSVLRDAILAYAPSVVQEETGIDYADLARVFNVTLYGNFTGPHHLFNPQAQRSLVLAYEAAKDVRPVPFRVSYQRQATSNLQVAVRPGVIAVGKPVDARLRALAEAIDAQLAQYAQRPRRLYLTRTASDPVHAEYVDSVRSRAAVLLGDSPGARSASALVSLTLAPDGRLRALHVERGSGDPATDRRVRAIAQPSVRFPAWPASMQQQADEAVVTLHLPE